MLSKKKVLDKKAGRSGEERIRNHGKRRRIQEREAAEVEKLRGQRLQELERISGLTSEQAKEYLLKTVEDEVKH